MVLNEELELIANRLLKAIEANDMETISKINEEMDKALMKLFLDDNK